MWVGGSGIWQTARYAICWKRRLRGYICAGCTYRGALLVWLCTPVVLKVTLQQGRSAAPFVSCPAQRSPALRARRASVPGSYLGVHLPPVIAILVTPFQSLLVARYPSTAHLPCGRSAALLCCPALSRPVNQFEPPTAGPVHACVRPDRRPELFLIEYPQSQSPLPYHENYQRPNIARPHLSRSTSTYSPSARSAALANTSTSGSS